jgi:hypothetical protein
LRLPDIDHDKISGDTLYFGIFFCTSFIILIAMP